MTGIFCHLWQAHLQTVCAQVTIQMLIWLLDTMDHDGSLKEFLFPRWSRYSIQWCSLWTVSKLQWFAQHICWHIGPGQVNINALKSSPSSEDSEATAQHAQSCTFTRCDAIRVDSHPHPCHHHHHPPHILTLLLARPLPPLLHPDPGLILPGLASLIPTLASPRPWPSSCPRPTLVPLALIFALTCPRLHLFRLHPYCPCLHPHFVLTCPCLTHPHLHPHLALSPALVSTAWQCNNAMTWWCQCDVAITHSPSSSLLALRHDGATTQRQQQQQQCPHLHVLTLVLSLAHAMAWQHNDAMMTCLHSHMLTLILRFSCNGAIVQCQQCVIINMPSPSSPYKLCVSRTQLSCAASLLTFCYACRFNEIHFGKIATRYKMYHFVCWSPQQHCYPDSMVSSTLRRLESACHSLFQSSWPWNWFHRMFVDTGVQVKRTPIWAPSFGRWWGMACLMPMLVHFKKFSKSVAQV